VVERPGWGKPLHVTEHVPSLVEQVADLTDAGGSHAALDRRHSRSTQLGLDPMALISEQAVLVLGAIVQPR